MNRPRHAELIVEGENDQHVISNLLLKAQIENHRVKRNEHDLTSKVKDDRLRITVAGSRAELLRIIATRIKAGDRSAIGFVVDADQNSDRTSAIDRTWNAITAQLKLAGVAHEHGIKQDGWETSDPRFEMRIGFWIMPNNESPGALEGFLQRLIDDHDSLMTFAGTSTAIAKTDHAAKFTELDTPKAQLACWLAWQEQPGRPPGQAIMHDAFRLDHDLAQQFVKWIRRLLAPMT